MYGNYEKVYDGNNALLLISSQIGQIDTIHKIIKNGKFNLNHLDSTGHSAIYYACKNEYVQIIKCLLDNKALISQSEILIDSAVVHKVFIEYSMKETLMVHYKTSQKPYYYHTTYFNSFCEKSHLPEPYDIIGYASKYNFVDTIKTLLKNNTEITKLCINCANFEIKKILITHTGSIIINNCDIFELSCIGSDIDAVKYCVGTKLVTEKMLINGTEQAINHMLRHTDIQNLQLLQYLLSVDGTIFTKCSLDNYYMNLDVLKFVVSNGAKITNKYIGTLIFCGSSCDKLKYCIEELKLDVNCKHKHIFLNKCTYPLWHAIHQYGYSEDFIVNIDVVKLLIEHTNISSICELDDENQSIFTEVCKNASYHRVAITIYKLIVDKLSDKPELLYEVLSQPSLTLQMITIVIQNTNVLVDSIKHISATGMNCLNTFIKNNDGCTGYEDVITLLVTHGCDINNIDNNGNSCLHNAILHSEYDMSEVVGCLLQNGCNPMHKNNTGSICLEDLIIFIILLSE